MRNKSDFATALGIARRRKKMAQGGEVDKTSFGYPKGPSKPLPDRDKDTNFFGYPKKKSISDRIMDRKRMAEGGEVEEDLDIDSDYEEMAEGGEVAFDEEFLKELSDSEQEYEDEEDIAGLMSIAEAIRRKRKKNPITVTSV